MHLLACQVSVTVGDSGLCRCDVFRALVHSLCLYCVCFLRVPLSLSHLCLCVYLSVCLSLSVLKIVAETDTTVSVSDAFRSSRVR